MGRESTTNQIKHCDNLAQGNSKTTTCHSCKHKCNDVWVLLQHVYLAHGLRVTEEDLPNFNFNENQTKTEQSLTHGNQPVLTSTPTSTFGVRAGRITCNQRLIREDIHNTHILAKSLTPGGSRGNFNLNAFCSERLKEFAEKAGEPLTDPNNLLNSPSVLGQFELAFERLKHLVSGNICQTPNDQSNSSTNSLLSLVNLANALQQKQSFSQPNVLPGIQDYYNPAAMALLGLSDVGLLPGSSSSTTTPLGLNNGTSMLLSGLAATLNASSPALHSLGLSTSAATPLPTSTSAITPLPSGFSSLDANSTSLNNISASQILNGESPPRRRGAPESPLVAGSSPLAGSLNGPSPTKHPRLTPSLSRNSVLNASYNSVLTSPAVHSTTTTGENNDDDENRLIVVDDTELAEPAARREGKLRRDRCQYCNKASWRSIN